MNVADLRATLQRALDQCNQLPDDARVGVWRDGGLLWIEALEIDVVHDVDDGFHMAQVTLDYD